jgi:hypothetical protein
MRKKLPKFFGFSRDGKIFHSFFAGTHDLIVLKNTPGEASAGIDLSELLSVVLAFWLQSFISSGIHNKMLNLEFSRRLAWLTIAAGIFS